MKKIKLVLLLLFVSLSSYSQTPWRTLTFTNNTGVNVRGNMFNQSSANLYYEIKNNYAITSWTGIQYQSSGANWFSSQATVVKNINGWGIGAGIQYGIAGANFTNSTFAVTTISYRFKL